MSATSGTSGGRWPLPSWGPDRLNALKAGLAVDSFHGQISQIKLLASNGDLSQAQTILRGMTESTPVATVHLGFFRHLLTTAILVQDVTSMTSLLTERFGISYGLEFNTFQSRTPPEVMWLTVRENSALFSFNESLFEWDGKESSIDRWVDIYPQIDAFMTSPYRTNGSVAINLGDGGQTAGLAFCDYRPGYFLLPDPMYMSNERYTRHRDSFRSSDIPWADRQSIAYWRGATTGQITDSRIGWRSIPRIRLCEISRDHPDVIDAGITSIVQISEPSANEWLERNGLTRPYVPAETFSQYKYQIDIDGNTNSWPGLFFKFLSGSAVLKVASPAGFQQWYYDRLKPWINYVPVDSGMSDLLDKLTWLRDHDDHARRIGEAGRELAESLTDEREITRAAPVIADAIRSEAGQPLISLDFSAPVPAHQASLTGWRDQETLGIRTALTGQAGCLELPVPAGFDDFVVAAEISSAGAGSRCVSIIVNGETILRQTIDQRTTLYAPLRRAILAGADSFGMCFRSGGDEPDNSPGGPLDQAGQDVSLHALNITTARCHGEDPPAGIIEVLTALNAVPSSSVIHDLWRPTRTVSGQPDRKAIITIHGTVLYADLLTGRVRHGPEADVPKNLSLNQNGALVRLIRFDKRASLFGVRIRPEAPRDTPLPGVDPAWDLTPDGFADTFEVVTNGACPPGYFGLRAAGLFACAEPDGTFTLNRTQFNGWETFHLGAGEQPDVPCTGRENEACPVPGKQRTVDTAVDIALEAAVETDSAEAPGAGTYFDELWYLSQHPNVAKSVQKGGFRSGWQHYFLHGREHGFAPGPILPTGGGEGSVDILPYWEHNGAGFLAPSDLATTPTTLTRIALIGSCQLSAWGLHDQNPSACPVDRITVVNGAELPDLPVETIASYDFVVVQVPLRAVIADDVLWHLPFSDLSAHEAALDRACRALEYFLNVWMKWNRERGLLTFVMNFFTPQQNPLGRLFPRFDLRNPEYFMTRLNQHLETVVRQSNNAYVMDLDRLAASIGRRFVQDDAITVMSHNSVLPLEAGYPARLEPMGPLTHYYDVQWNRSLPEIVWTELMAMYRTVHQIDPVKVVVVDLDDTLWNGVSGDLEDIDIMMVEGWPIGLAEALVYLKKRGVLLAIASKNEESRIREIWPRIFGQRLKLEDFAAIRINWRPKAENMREILEGMNLLPRNTLFIDDNPVERDAMARAFPGMRVLGRHPYYLRRILLWAPETQVASITGESNRRTEMVQAQFRREAQRKEMSREEFLREAAPTITLLPIDGTGHPRFARVLELINKTNQFNTTGRRLRREECEDFFRNSGSMLAFEASDRFTVYGLIGVVMYEPGRIVQWVMSCRVLGYQIEEAVMASLVARMRGAGAGAVSGRIVATEVNFPCRDLFQKCGFEGPGDMGEWLLPAGRVIRTPEHVTMVQN